MRRVVPFLLFAGLCASAAGPIRLHPANPHYYEFRGKPTVLITSAEHYGAVLNGAFDYRTYLDTLARDGLNLTRIFSGVYREQPGDFGIRRNTLAPEHKDFVAPWVRTADGVALDGLGRYDLKQWNGAYFARLKDFVSEASKRGIVVELSLFCTYYRDTMWRLSPLRAENNIQGIGDSPPSDVLTLKHAALVAVEQEFVRKVVAELREFDNVIYEICNEPYFGGVTLEWQALIAKTIAEAEAAGPRHLIAQNIANHQAQIREPNPLVGVFNFHYARPPVAVGMNYGLNRAIGLDETGFDGTADFIYRIQAWDFLLAGGAHYNNLDYSFAVGHEDGSFPVGGDQPGWGSAALRRQLSALQRFFGSIDFVRMSPAEGFVTAGVPEGASVRALGEPGRAYALYLHHGRLLAGMKPGYVVATRRQKASLQVNLPAGSWEFEWWNPRSGQIESRESLEHSGGPLTMQTPEYTEDISWIARRK